MPSWSASRRPGSPSHQPSPSTQRTPSGRATAVEKSIPARTLSRRRCRSRNRSREGQPATQDQPAAQGSRRRRASRRRGEPAAEGAGPAGRARRRDRRARRSARLRYRLRRKGLVLALERMIVHASGAEEPLRVSLASLAGRAVRAPASPERPGPRLPELYPTHEDLSRSTASWARSSTAGVFPSDRQPELFAALAGVADVELDGALVRVSSEAIGPRGTVRDHDDGAAGRRGAGPARRRGDRVGCRARCGAHAAPAPGDGPHGAEARAAAAPAGVLAGGPRQAGDRRRCRSWTSASRSPSRAQPPAPRGRRVRPRILLGSRRRTTLSVVPSLVYGDPPAAAVENGRLVHLSGAVPVRDEAVERVLLVRLRDELHLIPGRRVDFDGERARSASRSKPQSWERRRRRGARASSSAAAELVPRFRIQDDRLRRRASSSRSRADDGERDGAGAPTKARIPRP